MTHPSLSWEFRNDVRVVGSFFRRSAAGIQGLSFKENIFQFSPTNPKSINPNH
jgi:hypothetical protein